MENVLDRNISIENIYGNTIMSFKIDSNGNIVNMINCDIADIEFNRHNKITSNK